MMLRRCCSCLSAFAVVCLLSPVLAHVTTLQRDEALVRPNAAWRGETKLSWVADAVPVLSLQSRLVVPGRGGGCNWMLRIKVNGTTLTETPAHPRLLNKPPSFDFADGKYHFSWFNPGYRAWMTLFSDSYDVNTAGTGQDTTYLFDLSSYAESGAPLAIEIEYAQPQILAVLKHDTPLAIRDVTIGTLSRTQVDQLRERAIGGDKGRRDITVHATPDPNERPGNPPYEIVWAGRRETPPAQVSFEDLTGWHATEWGSGDVTVSASRAGHIWRRQVAKIAVGVNKGIVLELRPPHPIPLPADLNAVNCWVYSNFAYATKGQPFELTVTIQDARGLTVDLNAGALRGDYWEMRQGVASSAQLAGLRAPLSFQSLTLSSGQVTKPVTMYLESLAFWKRARRPLTPGEKLDVPVFPTTRDNMLPPAPQGCRATAELTSDGRSCVFRSVAANGVVEYRIAAEDGGIGGVSARFNQGPPFNPMAGGGIAFDTPTGQVCADGKNAKLVSTALRDGKFVTNWHFASNGVAADYDLTYQLRGRTLIVDAACRGGHASGLQLGKVRGLADAKGIEVPYLVFHRVPSPRIAMGDGVFTSVLVDWYHSNASVIDTTLAGGAPDADGLAINGGTSYDTLTDGRRNDLADRILVTISPEIHDTLPSVATPRSDKLEALAPNMFVMSSGFEPEYFRTLKRYGLDHVISITFAGIWWQRGGEGFSMRWRPRPDLSTEMVQRYRKTIKDFGYLWGMLVNYTCYWPGNEFWDENKTSLTADGALADGWYGTYDTKPNAMAAIARTVGGKIHAEYPTDCVYLDVHTNWATAAIDHEAGVDGAGTARETVLGNAACIREVHRQQGALCSEGISRWLYAGVSDMDYAQWVGREKPEHKPLLPDFDLLRIHPHEIGTAMGYSPTCFFTADGLAAYHKDPGRGTDFTPFYHYVTAILAHGHSAMIGYSYFPSLARTIHYYALLSGPQEDYLPGTVSDIAWYSSKDGRFVSTSDALRTGVRDDGKLRVTYKGGQVIYVNYHPTAEWKVTVAGRAFTLPPYGWVISKPGSIFAYSALMDGRRVDYVNCPRYIYLNSGGKPATEGGVTVDGAVFIKREAARLTVIPCGNLGAWKQETAKDYPMFQDRILAGLPADRGVKLLQLDARQLLPGAATVDVAERDAAGKVVAQHSGPVRDVSMQPVADVVDYCLSAHAK